MHDANAAGGSFKDAIGVCAHEMGDPQLALFIGRLLQAAPGSSGSGGGSGSTKDGVLLHDVINNDLLPGAKKASP